MQRWTLRAAGSVAAFLLVSLTGADLAAQFVSPQVAVTMDGASSNQFPWTDRNQTARRYQQIHQGVPSMTVTELAFRPNRSTQSFSGTNTLDVELWIGPGVPRDRFSYEFTRNFSAPPTLVLPRTSLTIGPQGQLLHPGPNPFSFRVPLATPFVHAGGPLTWEVVVYSSTYTGTPTMQAYDADIASRERATQVLSGVGCIVPGQPNQMLVTPDYWDANGILNLTFTVERGPANAPALLALGLSNPGLVVPGLCSPLYTDLAVVLPIGTLDANGNLDTHRPAQSAFVLPNPMIATQLFAQAHAIGVAPGGGSTVYNSRGITGRVPQPNFTRFVDVARNYNNLGGTAANFGRFGGGLEIGYGLVTRFQ